jgi:hypothetical protein
MSRVHPKPPPSAPESLPDDRHRRLAGRRAGEISEATNRERDRPGQRASYYQSQGTSLELDLLRLRTASTGVSTVQPDDKHAYAMVNKSWLHPLHAVCTAP